MEEVKNAANLRAGMFPSMKIWQKRQNFDSVDVFFGIMLHDIFLDVFEGLLDRLDLCISIFVDLVVFEAIFDAGAEFWLDFVFCVASVLLEILRNVFWWTEKCQLTVVNSRSPLIFM